MATPTLTIHVYDEIRIDILNGAYAPGSPLRVSPLAKRFSVSMSVVREALVRLAEQHLVALSPNQGFRVMTISRDDLVDLTAMRILVEGEALRRSIERGGVDWEARLVSTHYVLERAVMRREGEPGTTEEWSRAHAEFHDALGAGCESPRLIASVRSLRDSSELYRQISGHGGAEDGRDISGEHRELLTLATEHRAAEAIEALARHFQKTADTLLSKVLVDGWEQRK